MARLKNVAGQEWATLRRNGIENLPAGDNKQAAKNRMKRRRTNLVYAKQSGQAVAVGPNAGSQQPEDNGAPAAIAYESKANEPAVSVLDLDLLSSSPYGTKSHILKIGNRCWHLVCASKLRRYYDQVNA